MLKRSWGERSSKERLSHLCSPNCPRAEPSSNWTLLWEWELTNSQLTELWGKVNWCYFKSLGFDVVGYAKDNYYRQVRLYRVKGICRSFGIQVWNGLCLLGIKRNGMRKKSIFKNSIKLEESSSWRMFRPRVNIQIMSKMKIIVPANFRVRRTFWKLVGQGRQIV